ncbi:uncharacterized protein KY384_008803 [Bacidia gigantensis]|uniref:uncharacterized protein n=1 Tax=Bacidia gigantensis TaxID=2732470 RepID=UPI001D04FB69|nr:uncharacterized protein KY384_008803 [Bacidia gigantensis]KAG8526602.1 hypothetical protein KY384_008803 [Bacidia gigantensis]
MRRVKIFSGSSHPLLVDAICERLGTSPAQCDLKKFSNGETSVNINTSVRDQDVFIVQSGSPMINDSVMELLVMISACKGGSAKSITAVMPYFPYSRQSKRKSHRGAITAKLFANLLSVAGIHHVITVDLHAPPTQGFFGKPVDNLRGEPLIARWIKMNVQGWQDAVVVSKNPGGTKRVTSLADALKLNFAIVTTQPRRQPTASGSLDGSTFFDTYGELNSISGYDGPNDLRINGSNGAEEHTQDHLLRSPANNNSPPPLARPRNINIPHASSPLVQSSRPDSNSPPSVRTPIPRSQPQQNSERLQRPVARRKRSSDDTDEYNDERAREVVTGRLIQGHIVDDDAPSPSLSAMSGSVSALPRDDLSPRNGLSSPALEEADPMTMSFMSTISRRSTQHTEPAEASDEEEGFQDPELEHTVTLVGNVSERVVLIIDDMIDQCGSWIAAAETVVKRGDAKKVYCIATHGLFGNDSLEQMEACKCIDHIVVTNTYPIAPERVRASRKLVVLDISNLLSEAIRRNHYGESISALFQHYPD